MWARVRGSESRQWLPALVFVELGSIQPGGFASSFLDEVVVDGELIYSKKQTGEFPDFDAIVQQVRGMR